ncbi:cyclopropane-fatty-acyl-phospholipid synthase family protein [Solirubrobacter phytolaccae]|uniref:Cyclopropane-fatty-acyl-phospholipid synthase family protein n=1 Tax=Solirubrobacter phytolaccae TaxID=1404360 RepID=A0A9X3NFC9_9ACTN|nr:cyclopropane-fatty-acyl-phospholipid synthase family protein [Solirubrobacter phytolaccae]MDA0180582.1 cyclopropane-fatty-acyl-phospholipid synthase family protein [Solirubrobacter phytolaccae]
MQLVRAQRPEIASAVRRTLAGVNLPALPVTLRFWDGSVLEGGAPVVEVRGPEAIAYVLRSPNQIGLARAWVTGAVDVPDDRDLEAILSLRGSFRIDLSKLDIARLGAAAVRIAGPALLRRAPVPAIEAPRAGRLHSLTRDKAAIQHHYDVSNRFYELVLGPSMVYSCAYFAYPGESLEAAQARKLDRICRKLRLAPGERLLDIGCGWGSLLIHAAREYGVHGVGVTLSEAQAALARERVAKAGLSDRIEIRVQDYREITDGPFDKVSSVGMYEHVGRGELEHYTAAVHELLAPGGLFLNHGIARLHSDPPAADTFIYRYVFPDGELSPVTDVMTAMEGSGFEVRDVESLREHYPLTLRRWVANLAANRDAATAEVGEQRARVWRLYMLGSALGFEEGDVTVYQVLSARDGAPHGLPLQRVEALRAPACERTVRTRERRGGEVPAHTNGVPHR